MLKVVTLEGFLDPDVGEVLGADEELIGVIVSETKARFSIAKVLMQNSSLSVGDVANKLAKAERKKLDKKISSCKRHRNQKTKHVKKKCSAIRLS